MTTFARFGGNDVVTKTRCMQAENIEDDSETTDVIRAIYSTQTNSAIESLRSLLTTMRVTIAVFAIGMRF